jgi:hypothetical protein
MILISGDSWSCGEWAPDHPKVDKNVILHGGLAQYLKEQGYPVINLGRGGGSNLDSSTNKYRMILMSAYVVNTIKNICPYIKNELYLRRHSTKQPF